MADAKALPAPPHRRRALKVALILLAVVVVFGLLGFFAAPPIIRSVAQKQLTQLLGRETRVGHIGLNPYTLALEIRDVHVHEPGASADFVSFGALRVQASWASLFRLKPVITGLLLDQPYVHLVRSAPQRFNFSDLVDKFSKPSPSPQASKPTFFSVSNILISNGRVDFEDQVLRERHGIEALNVGIPFIANLPSQTDIYVQPSLDAKVDGSLLSVRGKTKPFATSKDSEIALQLDHVDVPKLLGYVPTPLPVVLQSGLLATDLHLHFAVVGEAPSVLVTGQVALSDIRVTDHDSHDLVSASALRVLGISAEPLRGVIHLEEIQLADLHALAARERDGTLNLAQLQPPAAPAAAAAEPKPEAPPAKAAAPLDFAVKRVTLSNAHLHFDDRAVAPASAFDVSALNVGVSDFSTVSKTPAHFDIQAQLTGSGVLAAQGTFVLPAKTAHAELKLSHLSLPLAQPYLAGALRGDLRSGLASLRSVADVDWSTPAPQILVGSSALGLDDLAVAPARGVPPVASLGHLQVELKSVDVAKQRAEVGAVRVKALVVHAVRDAKGAINLLDLVAPPPPPARHPAARRPAAPAPAWHYKVASADLSDSSLTLVDHGQIRPVNLSLTGVHAAVRDVSDDFHGVWPFDVAATLNRKGALAAQGTLRLQPVTASVKLNAKSLDIAAFEPYFGGKLNAVIASALLDTHASVTAAQGKNQHWNASFQGDVGVNQVRMLDRLTSDVFAGWRALAVRQIKASYSDQGTSVQVGKIDFASFYARIYLDSTGRLNLSNFVNQPQTQNESLTRTPGASGSSVARPAPAAPAAASPPAPAATRGGASAASAGPPLDLGFGEIDLHDGRVDYSDNFIKPNFNANLVSIEGTIGAFGSHSTQPATVDLQAKLDASGPVHISGSVNPLVDPPFLDATATARDIELTNFSTYSTKYTGYPIVKGNLTVDVHYKLDHNQLSANNHFFIDQFTFGDHVDSPTATNLPVRLAISLLKDRKGQIDIDLPVSGSLSDPQFSVGGLLWHAVLNLVEKAVTAPFSLIAGAFGGGSQEDLGYVEFDPGSDKISATEDAKIQKIGKGLADRPAVKLDLIGRVDPATDTPALKLAAVDRAVKTEKIRDVVGKGESVDLDTITLTPNEYNKYLDDAYHHAKFDKPSNLIGMTKSLPPEQEKQAMLDHAAVGATDLETLARRRAQAVQQDFGDKVGADRLFIVAPKLDAGGISDKGKTSRVEFGVH